MSLSVFDGRSLRDLLATDRFEVMHRNVYAAGYIPAPSHFIVFKDSDGTICARNGKTGEIPFFGDDLVNVSQQALNALTSGRSSKERVMIIGDFEVTGFTSLQPNNQTELDLRYASIKDANPQTAEGKVLNLIKMANKSNVDILGGVLDGQRGSVIYQIGGEYTDKACAILLDACQKVGIIGTEMLNWAGNGFGDHDGKDIKLVDTFAKNCGGFSDYEITNTQRYSFIRCRDEDPVYMGWNVCQESKDGFWKHCVCDYSVPKKAIQIFAGLFHERIRIEDCIFSSPNTLGAVTLETIQGLRVRRNTFKCGTVPLDISSCSDYKVEDNMGDNVKETKKKGVFTGSGDGVETQFTFAHGLIAAPNHVEIGKKHEDIRGLGWTWTADGTNITITFSSAPPSGTNNVVFSYKAEV